MPVVVDGEIVSLDSHGRSSFQRLQESQKKPAGLTYVAFDLLYADGTDLRSKPLEERKALLERLIRDDDLVLYSKHVVEQRQGALRDARANASSKASSARSATSTYQERRSRDWVKIKTGHEQEFVVGGWTEPKGSRKGFGALLLGVYQKRKLRYVGSVGTGFSAKLLRDLHARLRKLERKTSPFVNDVDAYAPRRIGRRRSSSSRCASPSGRATATCASRRISACVRISRAREVVAEIPEHV